MARRAGIRKIVVRPAFAAPKVFVARTRKQHAARAQSVAPGSTARAANAASPMRRAFARRTPIAAAAACAAFRLKATAPPTTNAAAVTADRSRRSTAAAARAPANRAWERQIVAAVPATMEPADNRSADARFRAARRIPPSLIAGWYET